MRVSENSKTFTEEIVEEIILTDSKGRIVFTCKVTPDRLDIWVSACYSLEALNSKGEDLNKEVEN